MPYWRLDYHVVWATRNRDPVIEDTLIEPIVAAIRSTSRDLEVRIFGVGVMPEHIHVFAQIPPTLAVAQVVGRWKGASSHVANAFRPDALTRLAWQRGYGALSVSPSGYERVLSYVQNQRERHARKQLYAILEQGDDETWLAGITSSSALQRAFIGVAGCL